ncbi:hypothetical protein D3C84_822510 [compost metagenome]
MHHVVAGLVVKLLQVFVQAAVIARAGAGDQENQRRGMVLRGESVFEFRHRPEIRRQLEGPLRAQGDAECRLVDVIVQRQFRAQVRWCCRDGRFKRIGEGIAITGGVDIDRQCGRTQNKAAKQGGEAQGTEHD